MFISPMLLHRIELPFDDESFITELKLDGFRTIWSKFDDKVRIYTRHKTEVTFKFPELLNLPLPNGTVLDGEIIVSDNQGKPDFEAVMERFMSRNSGHQISFCVFDILYYNGRKITSYPLIDRKEILEEAITEDTPLFNKVKWTEGNAKQYFELIKQHELEGIVQKRADSMYLTGKRTHDWLKVINYHYHDVYIAGIRKDGFGVLVNFENGQYAGLIELMSTPNRNELFRQYQDYILEENDKMIYLDPKIQVKVKYRNLTKKGLLRTPSFVEWIS